MKVVSEMPRFARLVSSTGIYHIMQRGINKTNLFLDQEDKQKYLDTLLRMKEKGEYTVYAYCLMDNHVHILIKEDKEPLSVAIKRIGVSYSYYFNRKYNRVGHLFQDRFRSEPIEDDRYFLACGRYIHNNPVKAGIVNKPEEYTWSSYNNFINYATSDGNIVDREFLLGVFSEDKIKAVQLLRAFTAEAVEDQFIDYDGQEVTANLKENSTYELVQMILSRFNLQAAELKNIDRKKRNAVLRVIKSETDASVRDLSKILGVSKDIIFRA